MMQFEEDFRDRGARKILMNTNYRSGSKIVDMADVCIRNNKVRFEKEFIAERGREGTEGVAVYKPYKSKAAEMDDIISVIRKKSNEGVPLGEMAILFRTNRQASVPIQALAAEDIPYYSTENVVTVYDGWMFSDIRAYIHGDQYQAELHAGPEQAQPASPGRTVQRRRIQYRGDDGGH
jgi:DNA helicase-2/ATP-dependent DNA helicase PcrA